MQKVSVGEKAAEGEVIRLRIIQKSQSLNYDLEIWQTEWQMKVKVSTVLDPEKTILRMVKSAEVITVQKSELEIVMLAISAKMPPLYSMVVQKGGKKKKNKVKIYQ